jgi:hypothetical protein
VDEQVKVVARRESKWRNASLEVSNARCVVEGKTTTCYVTAKNAGGTPIPIAAAVRSGAEELAYGAGPRLVESNASVDIALRAQDAVGPRQLAVCVYSLARTGGVWCGDVPVER